MTSNLGSLCLDDFRPLENRFGQNPCAVARCLLDACASDSDSPYGTDDSSIASQSPAYYNLYPLDIYHDETRYHPPTKRQASPCICSVVTYNLIQACAACQTHQRLASTLWSTFSTNCPATTANYPLRTPGWTAIPEWAYIDSSDGSMDIMLAFKAVRSNPTGSSQSAAQSTTSLPTDAVTTATPSSVDSGSSMTSNSGSIPSSAAPSFDGAQDLPFAPPPKGGAFPIYAIVMTVLAATFALAFFITLGFLWRRRSRSRRQGTRLRSSSDLAEFSDSASHGSMVQKADSQVTTGFLPRTDSYLSPSLARSFTTNSVSTGSGFDYAQRRRRNETFGPSRSTFYTSSLTATESSFISGDGDEVRPSWQENSFVDEDESSISPFADIHAPPAAMTTTRDNLHSIPSAISLTAASSFTDRTAETESNVTDSSSLLSSSTRAAPSSTGATYGRAHDSDSDDLVSLASSRRR